jgi:hydroxyethylthiazole kinase-like uncharacterized protein yjeF
MLPLYTAAAIRRLEHIAASRPQAPALMERAGLAAAEWARKLCGESGRDILVVAGPGNNGGDSLEVAVHLKRWFYRVTVVFVGDRALLSPDAAAALTKWADAGGRLLHEMPASPRFDLAVDGMFGIGLVRPLTGPHAALVQSLNALTCPLLSLDVPSGINGDTGAVMGTAVRATHTLTFIAHKPGLLTLDGPDHCGEIRLDTLGLEPAQLLPPEGLLLDDTVLRQALAPRARNFHKGQAGSVGILGGAAGMVGAASLAGRAALKCGAGRVYLGLLTPRPPSIDYPQPELMLRKPAQLLVRGVLNVLAAGPGMGQSEAAQKALGAAIKTALPLVLDADALNLIASTRALATAVSKRKAPTLMTPHPAEAARLLGQETSEVQANRIRAAKQMAERYRSLVLLKGNGSIVAHPDGRWWINATGNPGMASAGMGDVLTGVLAALLAQGAEPLRGLLAAVYLHGAAADALVASGTGPVGLTASEVIDSARALLNAPR